MAVPGKGGNFRENVVKEAKEQGVDVRNQEMEARWDKEDAEKEKAQKELVGAGNGGGPVKPSTVRGELMLAEFVKPHFSKDEDTRVCALELSFPLTKEHKGKLPKPVEEAWRFMERRHRGGVVDIEVSDQAIGIRLAPDTEVELNLPCARIAKAQVQIIKEIGKGASEKVVRFVFRAVVEATQDVYPFAATQFGNPVWIEMHESQGELDLG